MSPAFRPRGDTVQRQGPGERLLVRLAQLINMTKTTDPPDDRSGGVAQTVTEYAEKPVTASEQLQATPKASRAQPSAIARARGSRSEPTIDIQALLRRRLRVFALVIAAFYTLLLPRTLTGLLAAEATLSARLYETFKCCVLVTSLLLVYVLHRRVSLALSRLRTIEMVLFGMVLLQFAWVDYRTLFVRKLPAVLAAGVAENAALLIVGVQALWWFILIVGYGVLIPNTWRRSALVLGVFATVPVAISAAAGIVGDGIPPQMVGRYLLALCTWLGMCVAIAVYGSHRIELLREEAVTARRLGHYSLTERLGSGGMGEVYLAEHAFLKRPCAVKLIRPERARDADSLARFEREVQTTSTLTHPNTVQIYDYGNAEDGTFYYVMEFLPGLTLQQVVDREGPMSPDRAIRILRQICGALREAHSVGLIHCDVKPGNIILGDRGGEREVAKLLDFGLVRTLNPTPHDERLPQGGVVQGTPAFMSPEQALAHDLDPRSDIYSVGAVAFFLLTAQAPFSHGTPAQLRSAQISEPVVFPAAASLAVTHRLQSVILRCLEKDPARRFQTADSLGQALAACATNR
jgi:eukaryotic-like serine/threonine-protein kinase